MTTTTSKYLEWKNNLVDSPVTFTLKTEDVDLTCKLSYDDVKDEYILHFDDQLLE